MKQISSVFFDLDGTLADPKVGITTCMQYALGKLGRPVPDRDELIWCIGPPLRSNFQRLLNTDDPVVIENAVKTYRERYNTTGMLEYKRYVGIEDMLEILNKASFKLYVVSSKAAFYLPAILRNLSLSEYFRSTYGPGLDGFPDNKADLLANVLKELSSEPSASVMIGDREQDVIAGRANGTVTVAVSWGYGSFGEIINASPDYICHTPLEVAKSVCGLS